MAPDQLKAHGAQRLVERPAVVSGDLEVALELLLLLRQLGLAQVGLADVDDLVAEALDDIPEIKNLSPDSRIKSHKKLQNLNKENNFHEERQNPISSTPSVLNITHICLQHIRLPHQLTHLVSWWAQSWVTMMGNCSLLGL